MEEHQETTTEAAEEPRPMDPPVEAEAPPMEETPAPAAPDAPVAGTQGSVPSVQPEEAPAPETADPPVPEPEAPPEPSEAQAPAPPPIDTEMPRVGPKIVGMAEEKPPPIAVIKRLQDPRRPRRKRPNAAEKHRRAFFARLNELRGSRSAPKQEKPQAEEAAPAQEPQAEVEAEAVEAIEAAMPVEAGSVPEEQPEPPTPSEEQPEAPAAEAEQPSAEPEQPAEVEQPLSEETPARRQARLAAAIERVGGPETVRQALQPKRDDDGQPKKWAVVCCDASMGLKPGDPTFNAWVRLAATPVREIKGLVRPDDDRGERRGGRRRGAPRREGGEGRSGPRREGGSRGPRRERVSREEIQGAQDGSFKPTIRIIGLEDRSEDRKERERRRKDEREAKRKAERERLERLGY